MSDGMLACRADGKDIYFIKRPKNPTEDGFIRIGDEDTPIDFWSYVSRFPNLEIIDNNDYLKEMWFGDTSDLKWIQEYYLHGQKPQKS